jgi:hypothetical protein
MSRLTRALIEVAARLPLEPTSIFQLAEQVLTEQQNLFGLDREHWPDWTERPSQMLAELAARGLIEVWARRPFNIERELYGATPEDWRHTEFNTDGVLLSRLPIDNAELPHRVVRIHGYTNPQRRPIIGYDVLICRAPRATGEFTKHVLAEQQKLREMDPDVTERELQMLGELSTRTMIEVSALPRRFSIPHSHDLQTRRSSTIQSAASEMVSSTPTPGDPAGKPGRPTQRGTTLIAAEVRRILARNERAPTAGTMGEWLSGHDPDAAIPHYEAIRSVIRRTRDRYLKRKAARPDRP